jgi:adenosylcobinamide-GDP ribazoletransferase
VTQAPSAPAWRVALSLFTVIPAAVTGEVRRETAARAILWLPVVGALAAVMAAAALLAVESTGHSAARLLLAATLAVLLLALLTGGLHLDGLADTADGLGSRRPGAEALAIMRRPDVGPMGVAALVLVLLLQITALAAIRPGWLAAAALVLAVVTSRVAVLFAAGTHVPSARPDGFGALVAATTSTRARAAAAVSLLAAAGASAAAAGGPALAARGLAAALAGLLAAYILRRIAARRLGGMTGDVFGAIIEVSAATVLLVLALS